MMIDKYICRAKCIDNGVWVYGYPARLDYMSNEFSFIGSECIIHHIDQDTICRCTGLVDKYGNSILNMTMCVLYLVEFVKQFGFRLRSIVVGIYFLLQI